MIGYKIGRDRNGNKVCRVHVQGARGFSIQTNGNLERTHRDGVGPWTAGEVAAYVRTYGTERESHLIGV